MMSMEDWPGKILTTYMYMYMYMYTHVCMGIPFYKPPIMNWAWVEGGTQKDPPPIPPPPPQPPLDKSSHRKTT